MARMKIQHQDFNHSESPSSPTVVSSSLPEKRKTVLRDHHLLRWNLGTPVPMHHASMSMCQPLSLVFNMSEFLLPVPTLFRNVENGISQMLHV